MHFLILTQYFPPEVGAPQVRLAALIRALKRRGHEIEVVTAMPNHLTGKIFAGYNNLFYKRELFEGSIVRRTWVFAATGAGVFRLFNYLSFTFTSIIGLFASRKADYIFVESPPLFLSIPGWLFSFFRSVPMIFNVADLWPDSVRQLSVITNETILAIAEMLERWTYTRSRFVNAATLGIKTVLINEKSVPESKVLFLPNGVDVSLFSPREPDEQLLRSLGLKDKRVFIYAGTHGLAQGLDIILEAAALLKNTAGDVAFLLIGDGPTKQDLVRKASSLQLENVLFVDMQPLEEMPRYFSIAHASIAPLVKNELFKGARPSKMFPSLASGVPVIFCGEGEAAELLNTNGAGLAVEPENPEALANAVKELSADGDARKQMATNGRNLACEQFNWDVIVGSWLDQLARNSA